MARSLHPRTMLPAGASRTIIDAMTTLVLHDQQPDPPLDVGQSLRVSKLTQAELQEMDRVLLAQSSHSFRKVARIVGTAIGELEGKIPNVPDIYYAQRVQNLVALGKLESQGNLKYMRFSEVRLPQNT